MIIVHTYSLWFFFQKSQSEEEKKELTEKAVLLTQAAANVKLGEKIDVIVREWMPYNDYEFPDAVEAAEVSWAVPTVQRLWFG